MYKTHVTTNETSTRHVTTAFLRRLMLIKLPNISKPNLHPYKVMALDLLRISFGIL